MSNIISPMRTETFQKLQIDSGILLAGFDYAAITNAADLKTAIAAEITAGTKLLGVTRGGGTFRAMRVFRTPEVDGNKTPFVGGDFIDSMEAVIRTALIEVRKDNIKRLFTTATETQSGDKTTISIGTAINAADYLTNLLWVGDLLDGGLIAIELLKAINLADIELTWSETGEMSMPCEFHARQNTPCESNTMPFKVIFFDVAAENDE